MVDLLAPRVSAATFSDYSFLSIVYTRGDCALVDFQKLGPSTSEVNELKVFVIGQTARTFWVIGARSINTQSATKEARNTQSGTCEGSHLVLRQSRPSDAIIHTILLLLLVEGNQTLLENTGCK